MANAYKTTRQYMQAEAADKFDIIQLHGFGYAAVFIIFVRKIHFAVFMFFQPVIADCDLVGIAA